MKRYEYRLKQLGKGIAIGYGIGVAVAVVIECLLKGSVTEGFYVTLLVGSIISIFKTSSSGAQSGLVNAAVNVGRGMVGSIFSSGLGFGVGMLIFGLKFLIYGAIACILFAFAAISFPLTIIYTIIMYMIEKFKGEIDDSIANTLDNIVPIAAFVITVFLICLVIRSGK